MTRAEIEASNARIIHEASFLERIDYKATNGTEGFYIYDRRNGHVAKHCIRVYDLRALFNYNWKDIT